MCIAVQFEHRAVYVGAAHAPIADSVRIYSGGLPAAGTCSELVRPRARHAHRRSRYCTPRTSIHSRGIRLTNRCSQSGLYRFYREAAHRPVCLRRWALVSQPSAFNSLSRSAAQRATRFLGIPGAKVSVGPNLGGVANLGLTDRERPISLPVCRRSTEARPCSPKWYSRRKTYALMLSLSVTTERTAVACPSSALARKMVSLC